MSEKIDLVLARRVLEFTANPLDWKRIASAALDQLEALYFEIMELEHQVVNLQTIRNLAGEELRTKDARISQLQSQVNQ